MYLCIFLYFIACFITAVILQAIHFFDFSMYLCIYLFMYICMYVCTYVCVCMYVSKCKAIHLSLTLSQPTDSKYKKILYDCLNTKCIQVKLKYACEILLG